MPYKILLLEDDKLLNETISDYLSDEDYIVDGVLDPYTALDKSFARRYDCYLFDVNLPYESGFSLLEKLRNGGDSTPTIFITSREDKKSLIHGFDVGADDYIKKPLDMDELSLRLKAILKRQIRENSIEIGDFFIDCSAKELYLNKVLLPVTHKAVELLILLVSSKGEVVSTPQIEQALWHTSQEPSSGAIRVYVTALKKYFPAQIVNVRGIGYRFIES